MGWRHDSYCAQKFFQMSSYWDRGRPSAATARTCHKLFAHNNSRFALGADQKSTVHVNAMNAFKQEATEFFPTVEAQINRVTTGEITCI